MTRSIAKARTLTFTLLAAAGLSLGGCAKSDKASDSASADNVEMPAEQAMSGATGTPSPDASALASEAANEAGSAATGAASAASKAWDATKAGAKEASSAAKSAADTVGASAKAGVDAATRTAEKKM